LRDIFIAGAAKQSIARRAEAWISSAFPLRSTAAHPGPGIKNAPEGCVTFVKELVERIQYLQRDCSMDLVNSREELLLIAGSAALRGGSQRRCFSPDVLVLGLVFNQRSARF